MLKPFVIAAGLALPGLALGETQRAVAAAARVLPALERDLAAPA